MLEESGPWAYLVIFIIIAAEGIPFVGPFIPAQLFLLGAGFVARLGLVGPVRVWAVALVALYGADIVSFYLGRRYGQAFLKRLPQVIQRRTTELRQGLALHLRKSLILAQFLGPARALTPPLAGSAYVPWSRFLLWNAVGCVLWVTFCVGVGYAFGESYARIQEHLGRDALIVLLVLLVVYLGILRFRNARRLDTLPGDD